MSELGMLVNYEYCTGCQSCMVSCKNEKGWLDDPWGVEILSCGPYDLGNDAWEWDYIPAFTDRCDFCAERLARNEVPACQLHCLAACLEVGEIETLSQKMAHAKGKCLIYKK